MSQGGVERPIGPLERVHMPLGSESIALWNGPKEVMGMTNAADFLGPGPDLESMGKTLYVSRPELAQVVDRYVTKAPAHQVSPVGASNALIVKCSGEREEVPFRKAFEEQGWFVKTCLGPGKADCPIMRGERCPLRESVDAAVVFVDPWAPHCRLGAIPRLRCAADSSSPGVVALEGRLDPPRYGSTTAMVGALAGPEAVLHAVSTLLGSQPADDQLPRTTRKDEFVENHHPPTQET